MRTMVTVICLCLLIGSLYAADLASVIKDVETKYGRFEQEIQDITIIQDMRMIAPGGEMKQDIKLQGKGKKFRMESRMEVAGMPDVMETITIYDGKDAWMISPFIGKQRISDLGGTRGQIRTNWWDYLSENSTITGSEEVGGRDCYVIELAGDVPFNRLWLDKKNLVLVKAEFESPAGTTLIVYSDFRQIKGDWEMPYNTEMYQAGKLFSTSTTKSIEINKGLSDDLFNPDMVSVKTAGMEELMKQMTQGQ